MRRVRSQFLQSALRLGFVVRGRGVSGGAAVGRSFQGTSRSSEVVVVLSPSIGRGLSRAAIRAVALVAAMAALATFAMAAASAGAVPKGPVGEFGSGGSGDGEFGFAAGVAVSEATGDVYVVDDGNERVLRFDADGMFISEFGGAGSGEGEFFFGGSFDGVAVGPDGDIYVADTGNQRIQRFSRRYWGGAPCAHFWVFRFLRPGRYLVRAFQPLTPRNDS
jgi:DNA-binding beta-propeller fold protein YncE